MFAELRRQYPQANVVSIDYDPGASEVNQLNRIKLMVATAHKNAGTLNTLADWRDADRFGEPEQVGARPLPITPVGVAAGLVAANSCGCGGQCDCS
jgi:hypothetical protein